MGRADLPENVRLITDATLLQSRELLRRALIVVIPLNETHRAAGQLALMDALLMEGGAGIRISAWAPRPTIR